MKQGKSGNEFSGAACEFMVMEFVRQKNAEELNNSGKEDVGFGGQYVGGFSVGDAQSIL